MDIKSKHESYKENIRRYAGRTKIKHVNSGSLEKIKDLKRKGLLRYPYKRLRTESKVYGNEYKKNHSNNVGRRTQTLAGSLSSGIKNSLRGDENNTPDTGIEAVIYTTDKADAAVDAVQCSRRTVNKVKDVKSTIDTTIKGGTGKDEIIRKAAANGAKSGLRVARNMNTHITNQFQSDDTDLGIQSFAKAEKEVRQAYDTAKAVKNTSKDISNLVNKTKKSNSHSGEYIKNKIYTAKSNKYERYRKSTVKSVGLSRNNDTVKTKISKPSNKIRTARVRRNKVVAKKGVSSISRNIAGTAKKIVEIFLPGRKAVLVFVGIMLAVFFISSQSAGMVTALSQQYFMADNDVADKYMEEVKLLDQELKTKINKLSNEGDYDDVDIIYIGDLQGINTNFQEIFTAAAVKYEQDLTFSADEKYFVHKVHEKLYDIKISSEVYQVTDRNGEEVDKIRRIITVYSNDMEAVMSQLKFDKEQKAWARRLTSSFSEQFPKFAQQYGELTQEEILWLMENAPVMSDLKQKKLYDTALSIVGKVKYFWGGKSSSGWNDDWGEKTKVTAKGSDTTGTYRPFGLDCSGYVDWVYKTAGIGSMLSGGGTAYQFEQAYPVKADDLHIGDLAFLQMPNSSGINHVGIYIGKDDEKNNLYAHCQWGTGVTVNSYEGFKYFRRVVNFEE